MRPLKIPCAITLLILHAAGVSSAAQEGVVRALTDGDSPSRAPTWSPDGARLAFESNRSGQWGIYVLDMHKGVVERFSYSDANERYPAWSPDGRRLVSVCDRGGQTDLCVRAVGSREIERVIASPGDEFWPAWSPDGREIAFTQQLGDSLDIRIVRVHEIGSNPTVTTVEDGRWPRWSPDGSRLAFFSRRDTHGLDDEVYVLDRRSGDMARLTSRRGHDFCPAWSPKGDMLVVVSVEPDGTQALRILDRRGERWSVWGAAIIASRNRRGRQTGARSLMQLFATRANRISSLWSKSRRKRTNNLGAAAPRMRGVGQTWTSGTEKRR